MHLGCLVKIKEHLIALAAVRLVIETPFLHEILKQGTILHEHGTEHVHSLLAVTRVYLSRTHPIDYCAPVKGYMERERVNDITILSAVVESFKSGKVGSLIHIPTLPFQSEAIVDSRTIVRNIAMNILNVERGIKTITHLLHLHVKNRYGEHERREVTLHL